MKTGTLGLAAGLALALLLPGCKEIETTTEIFADGSIERTIVQNNKTDGLAASAFTLPVDSTWSIVEKTSTKDSNTVVTTARKKFSSAKLLQQTYTRACARPYRVKIDLAVEKKFRWFYTYYEYRESYRAYNPFLLLPKADYLTEKDLAAWIATPDSDDTYDDKVEEWLMAGVFEEFFQSLSDHAGRLHHPELTPAILLAAKDKLRTALMDSTNVEDLEDITRVCAKVLGTPVVQSLRPAIDSTFKVIEAKMNFDDEVRHTRYLNRVVMPGRVWASNGQAIDSVKVEWPVSAKQFFLDDYTMWAKSRRLNRGMVVLSAGIVLLALAGLVVPRLRRAA
ncbi:MAG TPA: hypothetical protein PKI62_04895 [bacterium]|nr:hypothetical protein [bacterium]HPR87528.1 hypothetical protein [bacterium]